MRCGRQGAWGAVWAEGTEGGCAQRLESAGPLREAGPRLGWADGRASSDLLSDIRAIRLGERGGTQPERVLWPQPDGVAHEKNRTDTQEECLQAWGPTVESGDRCCGSDVIRLYGRQEMTITWRNVMTPY